MDAVVYTSNTGSTEKYARLLGEREKLPVYSLKEAGRALNKGAEIVYLGWMMAGGIKGYGRAAGKYKVRAVCGVGMSGTDEQMEPARKKHALPGDVPLFMLQGGFDMKKLKGIYKLMMGTMAKAIGRKLAEKADKTAEENDMLELMNRGGDRVSIDRLAPVIDFLEKSK